MRKSRSSTIAALGFIKGRMYDYNNGRFLSVDPFIQAPTSTQSMNPYTYIFNNPLSGIDPTGYLAELVLNQHLESKGIDTKELQNAQAEASVAIANAVVTTALIVDEASDYLVPVKGGLKQIGKQAIKQVKKAISNGKESYAKKGTANKRASDRGSQREVVNDNCSFTAGTLVLTPMGYIEIQDLTAGDMVISKDDQTGEVKDQKINNIFNKWHNHVIELEFESSDGSVELIVTTDEHPFMSSEGQWTPAIYLEQGDEIQSIEGNTLRVISTTINEQGELAYNFEVNNYHTYSVGLTNAWVHNACKKNKTETIKRRMSSKEAEATDKAQGFVPNEKPHDKKPKWVTVGKDTQKNLPNKKHEKTAIFTVREGTTKKLADKSVDIEDPKIDFKENALPNGVLTKKNEPNAMGIGKDLLEDINKNDVIKVEIQ